jgi:hypothetical protein
MHQRHSRHLTGTGKQAPNPDGHVTEQGTERGGVMTLSCPFSRVPDAESLPVIFARLISLMQACAVEGGQRATVDHAVIRGLVTARPWCVAGLPLSCCGIRVPGTLSRVALTGPALRRACQMMIRAGLVSRWDDRARSSRQLASADAARVYSGCRARRHGFPRLAVRRARAALWTPVDKPLSMPSLL